ncbi:MAG: tyrosine-type recombinase/integrase [Proteobacteria bacterium]|nr:tyrosine-type recombinase/integrase [Pseudomonadota bacterium]
MNGNQNRPAPGSQIKVEPIRKLKDLISIKKLLRDNPRNYAIFVLGINTHMTPGELIELKVGQVKNLEPNEQIEFMDEKSGKVKSYLLNKACTDAISQLLSSGGFNDDDNLFKSQRGNLIAPSLNRLVKKWCSALNIRGNYGSHTLRKTWGYHQHYTYGVDIQKLKICFNHSSVTQTREYLFIEDKNLDEIFTHEL